MEVIKFDKVSKTYGKGASLHWGVRELSFTVNEGEVIGFVGPNGAGKSTAIKILSGILSPSSGSISVCDLNPVKEKTKVLRQIGIMFGNRSSLWFNIPGIESMLLIKDIYGISDYDFDLRLKKYASILEIDSILSKPVRQLSLGQRMKLEVLASILHHPRILILDEPTLGLDIVSKKNFREILQNLSREEKMTVFLTTHDLSDVEKVCDRVIFINKGQKILDFNNVVFEKTFDDNFVLITEGDLTTAELRPYFREKSLSGTKYVIPTNLKKNILLNLALEKTNYKIEKVSMEDVLYGYYNSKL